MRSLPVILSLFATLLALHGEDSSAARLAQSRTDLDEGRYSQAIANARTSADEFRATGDLKSLNASLRVLGLARLYSGSYTLAADSLSEALALSRQLHDFGNEIARLNDLGLVSYFQGRYREALDRYEEAQARVRQVPNDPWSPWARQVTTANIAILYQTLGQYDRALELYSGLLNSSAALEPSEQAQLLSNVGALRRRLGDPVKALETYRAAQDLYRRTKHADGEIAVLNNIGIVQSVDLNDPKSAEASFSAALALADQTGDKPLAVHARLNRAEARFREGQLGPSQEDFQFTVDRARQLGIKDDEWKALFGLSRLVPARAAHELLLQAVVIIESLRTRAGSAELRSTFLADKRQVYDSLIATAETPAEMFHWMERSRARSLLDQASSQTAKSLDEFRRDLNPETAVLEFWIGPHDAAVLWISASGAGVKRFHLPDFERARRSLADPHNTTWRDDLTPLAAELLSGIPVLNDPKLHALRIIPDGALALLPFEALPLNPKELVVQRFSVTYAPSAALSGRLKAPPHRVRWPWQPALDGFADPQPGTGTERSFTSLPHSKSETTAVALILSGKSEVHTGADALKKYLANAGRFPIVHLATHGQADLHDPDRSFVVLAPESPQARQYDYLFSKEVSALSFTSTDLVTLSACETNVGVFVPGEGLRGFAEAFLAAGTRSVLNSLWAVGDVSTEELMKRFYTRLNSGESAAESLRQAKLDFLAHQPSSHPAHWAAFVLTGEGDWQLPRLIGWPWLAAGALVLLLALAAGYLKLR